MIPEARINRAHGHRYLRKVTDVHVESRGHREDIEGSISEEFRSDGNDPVQLVKKLRSKKQRETCLFAAFEVVRVHLSMHMAQNVAARIVASEILPPYIRINSEK